MQEVKNKLEEKRKQKEKKLKEDKIDMIVRLNKIMNKEDEANLSRDEILEYVLNNIKPNINNKGNKTPITKRNSERSSYRETIHRAIKLCRSANRKRNKKLFSILFQSQSSQQ